MREPVAGGISPPARRRYLMTNVTINTNTTSVTRPVARSRKPVKESTRGATVEALSGRSRNVPASPVMPIDSFAYRKRGPPSVRNLHPDERPNGQQRDRPQHLQQPRDDESPFARRRVVMKTVKQHALDRPADRSSRRGEDRVVQIGGWRFDAIEISRNLPLRREHNDRRRVRKKRVGSLPTRMQSDRLLQRADPLLRPRQQVPT